ncbi:hypothetical protein M0R45_016339 [Rubus argutus]|uniref:Uncharacterized protein n=1 Tax=Rubus argutus TaxID=59490 RepID=A0AAW1XT37_RUBAR
MDLPQYLHHHPRYAPSHPPSVPPSSQISQTLTATTTTATTTTTTLYLSRHLSLHSSTPSASTVSVFLQSSTTICHQHIPKGPSPHIQSILTIPEPSRLGLITEWLSMPSSHQVVEEWEEI